MLDKAFPNRELKRDLVEFLVDPPLPESLSLSSIVNATGVDISLSSLLSLLLVSVNDEVLNSGADCRVGGRTFFCEYKIYN